MYQANRGILVSSSYPSVSNAWASVAASTTTPYQVIGFSGGGSIHAATVQLLFGSTVKYTILAGTRHAASEFFGELGPVSAVNERVAVHTIVNAGEATHVSANLLYRIIL